MLRIINPIRNKRCVLQFVFVLFTFLVICSSAVSQGQVTPSIRLHHGGISVKNMTESIAFYRDVLGFVVDTEFDVNDEFKIVHMRNDDFYIELFWLREHEGLPESSKVLETDLAVLGTKHIGFETSDIEAMYELLMSKGVEMEGGIRMNNPYYKYFFFKDPNGILLEFVSRKP